MSRNSNKNKETKRSNKRKTSNKINVEITEVKGKASTLSEKLKLKEDAHKKYIKSLSLKFKSKIDKIQTAYDNLEITNLEYQKRIAEMQAKIASLSNDLVISNLENQNLSTQTQSLSQLSPNSSGGIFKQCAGFISHILRHPMSSLSMLKMRGFKEFWNSVSSEQLNLVQANFNRLAPIKEAASIQGFHFNIEDFHLNYDKTYTLFGWVTHKKGISKILLRDAYEEVALILNKERKDVKRHFPDNRDTLLSGFEYSSTAITDIENCELVFKSTSDDEFHFELKNAISNFKIESVNEDINSSDNSFITEQETIEDSLTKLSSLDKSASLQGFNFNIEHFYQNGDKTYTLFGWVTHESGLKEVLLRDGNEEKYLTLNKERKDIKDHYSEHKDSLLSGFEYSSIKIKDVDSCVLLLRSNLEDEFLLELRDTLSESKMESTDELIAAGSPSFVIEQAKIQKMSSIEESASLLGFNFNIESFHKNRDETYTLFGWITHKNGLKEVLLKDSSEEKLLKLNKKREDIESHFSENKDSLLSGLEYPVTIISDVETCELIIRSKSEEEFIVELKHFLSEIKFDPIERVVVSDGTSFISELKKYQNKSEEYYKEYQENDISKEVTEALKLITFYLPQFHQIPENDEWWGKGFTEWTNVTQATPKFEGHYHPRLPSDLGFYNLDDISNIRKQIEIAKNYGIYGFCFHHYWFSGKRLLEKPLDLFLESDIDFNFCICWANENWTRRWDGMESEVLIAQEHSEDDPVNFIKDLLPYLNDNRYIKLNEKHLIIIYRPNIIPNIKENVKLWREELKKNNIEALFACVQGFGLTDPNEVGFDIALEFPPHKVAVQMPNLESEIIRFDESFEGNIHDYKELINRAALQDVEEYPLIRGISPSWDNEARRKGKGTTAFINANPSAYAEWLEIVGRFALKNRVEDNSVVFINAWNEWAEGAYLEPDKYYGYNYLETTHNVIRNLTSTVNNTNKIIVVSHDAYKHGAQVLAFNIGLSLKRQFGYEITYLLLDDGPMVNEFREVANTIVVNHENKNEIIADLSSKGYSTAIVNSAVSGLFTKDLKENGFHCTNLIHELPKIIEEYDLQEPCQIIHEYSDKIVFPSDIVQQGFLETLSKEPNGKELIMPQGIFNFDISKVNSFKKGKLRKDLKLDKDTIIIGGIGFADERKGIDLFLELAKMISVNRKVAFVWIGPIKTSLEEGLKEYIDDNQLKDIVYFLPYQNDLKSYSIDFDIFTLTSREDPFPSVIIESLALGVPVVAFDDAGGFVDLNKDDEILQLAKYLDLADMKSKIEKLIDDELFYHSIAQKSVAIALRDYQFDNYCFNLTSFSSTIKKISVVVPNYNYANELEERLVSIWNQTYPVFEVIVLDDKSSDNSLEVIQSLSDKYRRKIKLVTNDVNSGSVFSQWKKGVNLTKAEYVWIAEADDSAEPNFLETLVEFFDDKEVGMAYCQSKQINAEGKLIASDYHYYTDQLDKNKWKQDYIKEGALEIKEAMSIRNTILNVSSVLFRTEILKETILENIEFAKSNFKVSGDWFFYVKMLEKTNIGYSAKSLNIHRRHDESTTNRHNHLHEIIRIHDYIDSKIEISKSINDKRESELKVLEKYFNNV